MIYSICFIICLKSVNILSPRSSHSSFAQSLHFHPCSPSPWRGDIWWDQEWTCDATLQIYFKTVEDNNIQGQAYLKWDHHIQWAFSSVKQSSPQHNVHLDSGGGIATGSANSWLLNAHLQFQLGGHIGHWTAHTKKFSSKCSQNRCDTGSTFALATPFENTAEKSSREMSTWAAQYLSRMLTSWSLAGQAVDLQLDIDTFASSWSWSLLCI